MGQEDAAFIQVMELVASKLLVFMKTRQPGDIYVLALRPNAEGLTCSGKLLLTLDPANPETYKAFQDLEEAMKAAQFEASQQRGSA